MKAYEVNFDGLAGPTHNYAGLAYGNLASVNNAFSQSNPKLAVKQCLTKMSKLINLGLKQGLIPPQARPNIPLLRQLGFEGSIEQILRDAYRAHPRLLAACYSSSSMWTANAATVSPSADTSDHKVHFTAANLASNFHRHQEASSTYQLLKLIFANEKYFKHHQVLPSCPQLGDEGAANHGRFSEDYGTPGMELFVFGRYGFPLAKQNTPKIFPARQTYEACAAIARLHNLNSEQVVFAQQNPQAIEQGVFHNDVIAVSNQQLLFYHQHAFLNTSDLLTQLQTKAKFNLNFIEVADHEVSLKEAVSSYLFNSQLLTLPNQEMLLLAPIECHQNPAVKKYLAELLIANSAIRHVEFIDCRQSMQNGGGPACLRLRVVLTDIELQNVHQGVIATQALLDALDVWSEKFYREQLTLQDFLDPKFVDESNQALDELTQLLGLGSIYYFQKA